MHSIQQTALKNTNFLLDLELSGNCFDSCVTVRSFRTPSHTDGPYSIWVISGDAFPPTNSHEKHKRPVGS